MGCAAQGYQTSSSRLPVKIPILICSMVLHAYLFFSALKKNPPAPRTVNYSSGLRFRNRRLHDTSGAFPLCNKFSESSREKRIGITCAWNPFSLCGGIMWPAWSPPLGKSKNSYIKLGIFNDFEGVTVLRWFYASSEKRWESTCFWEALTDWTHTRESFYSEKQWGFWSTRPGSDRLSSGKS